MPDFAPVGGMVPLPSLGTLADRGPLLQRSKMFRPGRTSDSSM